MCVPCKVIIDSGASQGAALSFAEDLGGNGLLRAELLAYGCAARRGCEALQAAYAQGHFPFPPSIHNLVNDWCDWAAMIDGWHYGDNSDAAHKKWASLLAGWRQQTTSLIREFAESVGGLGEPSIALEPPA